jgi:hypothetical protein
VAASVVAICNRALDIIGQKPIVDLEDPGTAAGACKRNYELSRDAVTRAYPWNCATRRASLAALTEAPAWGFGLAYQVPADCLRVMDSEGDLDGVKWRREGNTIVTDAGAPLRIRYIARITDPGLFDALLADAIAAHLAMMIAQPITGSDAAVQRAAGLYQQAMRQARQIDAQESSQDEALAADTWLLARF